MSIDKEGFFRYAHPSFYFGKEDAMEHVRAPVNLFAGADRRHFKDVSGMAIFALRDDKNRVQAGIHLKHRTPIDEHWLKKLVIRFSNPAIDFSIDATVASAVGHEDGCGSMLQSAWVFTHTGLAYFHPVRSLAEVVTPSGRIIATSSLFLQAQRRP